MSIQKRAKLVPWIAALAVAVLVGILAVPSLAAPGGAKNFSFTATPGTVNAGAINQSFSVTVTNTSPDTSSSNFSSMTVKVPSQFTGINSPAVVAPPASTNTNSGWVVAVGTSNASCKAAGAVAQTINVCNLDPTKRLQQVTITFKANVADLGCGSIPSDNWVVTPYTGSTLTGTGFTEKPVNQTPYTLIQKACLADIKGQVWRNHNNNTTKDQPADVADAETGQSGFKVIAFDSNGPAGEGLDANGNPSGTPIATTNANGNYTISSLPSGVTYTVCEFAPNEQATFEYRTWYQKVPGPSTSCSGHAVDRPSNFYVLPNGNLVTLPSGGANNVDFLNARAVTVSCPGVGTYSVGGSNNEPSASVTIPVCKEGVYVFEAWIRANDTQETDFYPTFSGGSSNQVTQTVNWALTGKVQSTLEYDDNHGFDFRPVLFCEFDAQDNPVMPTDLQTGATTCLLTTSEEATDDGVSRVDTIVTLVDGKLRTGTG